MESVLGRYHFDRETKNTVRYQRTTEDGRPDTIYVRKEKLEEPYPQVLEVVIRTIES